MYDNEWEERLYDRTFEDTCARIRLLRYHRPDLRREEVEGTLEALYVKQGNDPTSHGGPGDVIHAATIAAYEAVLAQWRKEEEASE